MASLYDQLAQEFEQEDGIDASDTSGTEAIVSGDDLYSDIANDEARKIKEARARAFRGNEGLKAPFDVMESVEHTKRTNAKPELSIGRVLGAGKEGAKDTIRQLGVFQTYATELTAMRNMSDEYLKAETETPFSTFGPGVQVRDEFIRTIPIKDRAEILGDPDKFAKARRDYIVKNNTEYAANARMLRAAFQEVYKADPSYFASSGWVEDFARMGPDVAMQVATGALTGGAGSAAFMFGKIAGATIEREVAKGNDPNKAMQLGLLNATMQAPLEALGIGRTMKWLKPRQAVTKKLKEATKVYGQEFATEYLQAYPELMTDLLGDDDDPDLSRVEKFLDIVLKDDFQKGALKEGAIAAAWAGVIATPGIVSSNVKDDPKTNASDLNKEKDVDVETVAPGKTIVKKQPEVQTPDVRSESKADGSPTIEHLMAVNEEGGGVNVDDLVDPEQQAALEAGDLEHPSLQGRALSDDLQATPKQKTEQLGTNDSIKSILEDVKLSKGLQKQEKAIVDSETAMFERKDSAQKAALEDRTQDAFDAALAYQDAATKQVENVQKFVEAKQEYLAKDEQTMPEEELNSLETYVTSEKSKADEMVAGLTKKVEAEKVEALNQFSEELEKPEVLKKSLKMAEAQDTVRSDAKGKIYRAVTDMMDLEDYTTPGYFLEGLSLNKLVKSKSDLERQMSKEQLDLKVTPEAKAVDKATADYLDEQIRRKQGFDLEMDLAKERDVRAKEEQAKLKEGAKRLTSSDPKVKADRAKVRGEKVTRTQERIKQVAAAKAKKATAQKAKTQEKKRVEVQKQQPAVRKKPATPVADDRRQEIQASRKRAMARKKQRDDVAKLDKKTHTMPKKATIKDLKDPKAEYVILTPDNPQSTEVSKSENRRARMKLIKELQDKGIDFETVDAHFEGTKEKSFIIKGMTKEQGKELSDRLNQSSYIHAKGENLNLIEGSSVNRVKKADAKVRPDSEVYTVVEGKRWAIPFYTDKASDLEIDSAQYQMDPDEVRSAKQMFRGAAINYKGKTYEGPSHTSILMQNDELTQAVLDTPAHLMHSTFDHGFVTHQGQYVDRMAATKALNLKKGAYLQSENFIQPALKIKAEQLQKETNMEIDNFDNMTLKDQMGTLEMVDELKSKMATGKYKWLFDKTKDLGVETHFITAKGQYKSMDAVKKVYPGMKELDAAVTRFEGDLKLDQATGWMIPTGGVRGLYLRMQPMKGNFGGQAIINMPIIGKKSPNIDHALETVVHEHIHGLVDHGVKDLTKNLNKKKGKEFMDELDSIWSSIPQDFIQETRDDKNTHQNIRNGINQIQRDGYGELITYSLAHPEFANWLNTIPASTRFKAKSSKIKTVWDSLVDLIVNKVMKVPTKLNEVNDVLNRYLKMGDADVRYSKETDFDFGANVSLDNVTEWNQEMIDQASDIAESVVVQTVEEAEKLTGKKIVGKVPSIWTGETKVKTEVYGGKKPKTITTVSPEKVIFIADNINSQEHFVQKWMHEQVTHHGLRSVFGENKPLMNRFLEQAYGLISIKDRATLEEIQDLYDLGTVDSKGNRTLTPPMKRIAAEEVLALRSEQLTQVTKRGLITRFKKFLARWLPKKFVGVKDTFRMKDQDIWDMLEATKAKVIMGDTKFATMLVKSLEARGPRHAYKGWKTLPKFMESDETYMEWVAATHKSNPGLRKWYDKHTAVIEKEFGPDADLFQVLLAITSPQADVETNVQFAVDTYAYLMGKKDKPGGLYPNTLKEKKLDKWTTPEGLFRSLESVNFKVTEFGRALLGDVDATVGDLWMFRAFFGDHAYHKQAGETFSKPNVVAMRQKLHDLAQKMTEKTGETHTPREIQAAIWIHVNSQSTGKDLKEVADYMSGLKRVTPKYGDKTPLEWLKTQVPNLSDGPLSKKLGVTKMPLAPMSPLAKQRIQQIRMEMKAKKLKTKYDVNKSGHILFKPVNEDTDIQNLMDALVEGGRSITPVDQTQGDWLKEMFGFEYQDDNTMVLSERAENLFKSEKKGKVSFGDIRDNLGGFSGAYTQEVRFAREARESTEAIAELDVQDPKHDAEWIMTGNEGSSVVNQIHEKRDTSERRVDRFITKLEQDFLKAFGGRRTVAGKSGLGTTRLMHTRATEVLQRAMNLHIDSGTGANRAKAEAYAKKLRKQGGKLTGTQREQLATIDRMLSMTAGEIGWVNENIRPYYEDYFKFAQDNKLVDSHRDNYVKRMWQMPKKYEDAGISWSGSNATTGFTLTPTFGKQRTLDSIIDGWEEGMTLLQGGVLNNLGSYANEMGYVMANRQFVEYMRSLKTFKSGGLMHEYKSDSGIKPPEGYTKLHDRGFAKPGHVVYAKTELANLINKLSDKPSWKLWNIPFVKGLARLNSRIKSTILSVSLFHHLAGMRSYILGVRGKKLGQWNPIKAYKRGLAELDAESGTRFQQPEYNHLGPIVDMLIKEGLTVGRTQDWDEAGAGQVGFIEGMLEKRTSKLGYKALRGWQAARRAREQMTTGLFNRLFAGLKAEAGSIELIHKIHKKEKKLGRSLTDAEIKLTAQQVATLVNADFGGLHLKRMGRNPDLQKFAQMTLLAPDWTESNWRTVTGAMGLNKVIDSAIKDNPQLKGMPSVYRNFWSGVAVKSLLTLVLGQAAILALFADEEEREEYYDFMIANATDPKKFTKGRWASWDLTPVLGKTEDGKRRVFSVLGHFKDILKAGAPTELAKHKVSPTARIVETLFTGTDWKGARFQTAFEQWADIKEGKLPAFTAEGGKYAEDVSGLSWWLTIPALIGYNARQSIPIFGSNALEYLQGESTLLAAGARAGGMDVRDVSHRSVGQRKYEDVRKEINSLDRNLKEAKASKDRTAIREAKQEIKEYPNFNQAKSRMNYARTQLSVVNKKIKGLEKLGTLSPKQERELRKLQDKKESIFAKFFKVINR